MTKLYVDTYGFNVSKEIIYDKNQHVWLCLLESNNNYFIELIQPIDVKSPSFDFLQKGGGLHHICYKVEDISSAIVDLVNKNHLLFKKPISAPLFNNNKVAFLFSKNNKQIIELLEEEQLEK
jgi:methylmalonyl-CoA/ethylmalonyl-CoA epimerase